MAQITLKGPVGPQGPQGPTGSILTSATVTAQTGTTCSLAAGDNGKVMTLNNASPITVTVPSGLGAGFTVTLVQIGAGQVTLTPSSTTINNRYGHAKLSGNKAVASLVAYEADVFVLSGDTSA